MKLLRDMKRHFRTSGSDLEMKSNELSIYCWNTPNLGRHLATT